MTPAADRFYMGLALELAARGLGRTSPNPAVGCVVVRDGRVVGRGYHARAGEPHAEVFALEEAGDGVRHGDLYLTLEPCAHRGRTPACAPAVVAAGPRRVVVAQRDPNPAVSGKGLAILREAGLEVVEGIREAEARRLNEGFCLSIRAGRAFVHLKLAATLDGKIATRSGDSRWISSPESRLRVHHLRDRCGAVIVGAGTVTADDPRLTVRFPGQPERRPLRVVLDPRLRCPPDSGLLAPGEAAHTLVACSERADPGARAALRERGASVEVLPDRGGGLDLERLLRALYRRGHMEVLVEGGAETARRFVDAGLVDRLHLFLAPRLLGGRDALSAIGGTSPDRIDCAWDVADLEIERVGPDLYVTGRPSPR